MNDEKIRNYMKLRTQLSAIRSKLVEINKSYDDIYINEAKSILVDGKVVEEENVILINAEVVNETKEIDKLVSLVTTNMYK
jgi:hypothetical protein